MIVAVKEAIVEDWANERSRRVEEKEGEGQDEEGGKKSDREAGDEEEEEEIVTRGYNTYRRGQVAKGVQSPSKHPDTRVAS